MALSIVDPSTPGDRKPPPWILMPVDPASTHGPLRRPKIQPKKKHSIAIPLRHRPAHAAPGRHLSSAAKPRDAWDEMPHQSPPKVLIASWSIQCQTKHTKKPRKANMHLPISLSTCQPWPSCQSTKGSDPRDSVSKNFSWPYFWAQFRMASPKARTSSSSVCR